MRVRVPAPHVAGPGQGAAPGALCPDAGPRLRRRFCCSRAREPPRCRRDSADAKRRRGRWPARGVAPRPPRGASCGRRVSGRWPRRCSWRSRLTEARARPVRPGAPSWAGPGSRSRSGRSGDAPFPVLLCLPAVSGMPESRKYLSG